MLTFPRIIFSLINQIQFCIKNFPVSPIRLGRKQLKLRYMGTQRGQIKGVLSWLARWACRTSTRDFCSALAAIVGPVQNIFLITVLYFNAFVPSAQEAGQPAVLGSLPLSVSLWEERYQSSDAFMLFKEIFFKFDSF